MMLSFLRRSLRPPPDNLLPQWHSVLRALGWAGMCTGGNLGEEPEWLFRSSRAGQHAGTGDLGWTRGCGLIDSGLHDLLWLCCALESFN